MKCIVQRTVLLDLVAKIGHVPSGKGGGIMAGQVAIEVSGQGALRLGVTNTESWLEVEGVCVAKAIGRVAVHARRLVDVVGALRGDSVTLDSDGKVMHIRHQRGSLKLVAIDLAPDSERAEEGAILSLPDVPWGEGWSMSAGLFGRMCELSAYAADKNEQRDAMRGVLLEARKGELRFVATNGYRLAMARVQGASAAEDCRRVLVVSTTLGLAARVIQDGQLEIVPNAIGKKGLLGIGTRSIKLVTRTLDAATFPPYDKIMGVVTDRVAEIRRSDLRDTLGRMRAVAGGDTRRMTVSFADGEGICRVETPDVGSAEETLSMKYRGAAMDMSFNADYLNEVVERGSGEKILWKMSGEGQPSFFEDAMSCGEGAYYLAFVSPLRKLGQ